MHTRQQQFGTVVTEPEKKLPELFHDKKVAKVILNLIVSVQMVKTTELFSFSL